MYRKNQKRIRIKVERRPRGCEATRLYEGRMVGVGHEVGLWNIRGKGYKLKKEKALNYQGFYIILVARTRVELVTFGL
jgi:hypothetical protein